MVCSQWLQALKHPQWIPAMVAQIKRQKYFTWHDAGDLQSVQHLKNIFEVCKQTPSTKHWLPTREVKYTSLMDPAIVPTNLKIIISDHMIDQKRPVKSCEKFLKEISDKLQAASDKQQAASDKLLPQLRGIKNYERKI